MEEKRPIWTGTWKYKEGLFVVFGLLLVGLSLEYITASSGLPPLKWPKNLIGGAIFLSVLVLIQLWFKRNAFVVWLSSIPASIVSVVYFTALVFILGFSPQDDKAVADWVQKLGFSHMASSWTLMLAQLFMLSSLGLVTIRRLFPFRGKNIGFFLNHAGLWIALMAGTLGAGDFYRLKVPLVEGKGFTPIAYDENNNKLHLPFSMSLEKFEIEEYTPELALYNIGKREMVNDLNPFPQAVPGSTFQSDGWKITVMQHLPFSLRNKKNTGYESSKRVGAVQAAQLEAVNLASNDTVRGWVSAGNFIMAPRRMKLSDSISVVMHRPEVKAFRSRIKWKTKDNKIDSAVVEVNKPVKIGAWKVYQMSYDSDRGRWSEYSVLEAITDYWLPTVYLGLFMMLAGALYLFWQGREFRKKKEVEDE